MEKGVLYMVAGDMEEEKRIRPKKAATQQQLER